MEIDKKISGLDEMILSGVNANDILVIVDISETETMHIKLSTLLSFLRDNTELNQLKNVDNSALPDLNALLIGNGTEWIKGGILDILPSPTGNSGKLLQLVETSDGFVLQWVEDQTGGTSTVDPDTSYNWVAQGQLVGTTSNSGVTIASNVITLDMGAFNSFDLGTLAAGTYTFASPTGLQAGVSYKGDIRFTNPSTGTVSFVYNAIFKGLNAVAPTINTTANANVFFEYSTSGINIVRLTNGNRWA